VASAWAWQGDVLKGLQGACDISRHGNIAGALSIIPDKGQATVTGAAPIGAVICVGLRHAKIFDDETEDDVAGFVFSQAGRHRDTVTAVWRRQLCNELVIGVAAGLGQAVPAAANIDEDKPVVDKPEEIVQLDSGVMNHPDGHSHVLVAPHGRAQIKILELGRHELCVLLWRASG
jgi:hypothetical protein